MKTAVSHVRSLGYFDGHPGLLDWLSSAPAGRRLIVSGLLSLLLIMLASALLGPLPSSVKPAAQSVPEAQPLRGTWDCSLAGTPIGKLTVDGWDYVLGGGQAAGTLGLVVFPAKYHEEVIRVPSGTLREKFGAKLGFHYKVAGEPEMLVFNIGPASGIRCTRV